MYGVKVLELDKSWMEFIRKIFIIRFIRKKFNYIYFKLFIFIFVF